MSRDSEVINVTAEWQPDESFDECFLCQAKFTFLARKHHCRCCGKVFCASCTDNFLDYDETKVKIVTRWPDEIQFPPFRTCNDCCDILKADANLSQEAENEVEPPDAEENTMCPICNTQLSGLGSDQAAQEHVESCITKAERIQQHQFDTDEDSNVKKSRMLVFKISENSGLPDQKITECPICFEDMVPGDKVGRLECLCVFHYDCIKSWFKKKKQLIKESHQKNAAVNHSFCPLHDAII